MNSDKLQKSAGRPFTTIDVVLWLTLISASIIIIFGYYLMFGWVGILIGLIAAYVFSFLIYHLTLYLLTKLVIRLGWDKKIKSE
jgi:hypothetical protein